MSEFNQDAEQSENQERPYAAFDALEPHDFLALWRIAFGFGVTSPDCKAFESSQGFLLDGYLDSYLSALPSRNLERAKVVYETFANSARDDDRYEITLHAPTQLTLVDHDAGVALWHRLVRDPNPNVRREARSDFRLDSPTLTERWGLTSEDAQFLDEAYLRANRGENLHDPLRHAGEVALRHLVQIIDTPRQHL